MNFIWFVYALFKKKSVFAYLNADVNITLKLLFCLSLFDFPHLYVQSFGYGLSLFIYFFLFIFH